MSLRLLQLETPAWGRIVALLESPLRAVRLSGERTVRELALAAIAGGVSLRDAALARRTDDAIDPLVRGEVRIFPPIDHPDPAHLLLSGTGLTHLGSAESRDRMHRLAATGGAQTDSMRIFLQGLEGGKPAPGGIGVQPEWFYKGDGSSLVATDADLVRPAFALDGGEEPELAAIYLIDADGKPCRLGFCLANEFSDHIMERENYLWLAHSKLRQAALGAELLTGAPPPDIRGTSRIVREGNVVWEKPFLTGEHNMSHSIANLEHHHFKYAMFRRPGDVHVHFFGCATLSFADGISAADGDVFEIRADAFLLPLRNRLVHVNPPATTLRFL
ncbi:MAG TPA: AraD1 family protein [Steroidobacteraceae bacterium]